MSPNQDLRSAAVSQYESLMPLNTKLEEFKYTDLSGFSFQKFSSDFASKLVTIKSLGEQYPGAKVMRLSSASSDIEISGDFPSSEITILPWSRIHELDSHLFNKSAEVPSKLTQDPFSQWIAGHASHGLFIKISKNVQLKEPIQIIHRLDSTLMNHRVCIWLEEGSSCSVIEEYRASFKEPPSSVPTQVGSLVFANVQKNAKLQWTQVQALPTSVTSVMRSQVQVHQNASAKGAIINLGSAIAHYHLEFHSMGQGSDLNYICANLGTEKRHCDFFVRNSHPEKNSTSETKVLNVVGDDAFAVFNGMIEIPKNAPKVDAAHRSKSLVLSKNARVQANPKLEISTDDVKCAHGASISSIDPAQLYYLRSRGISKYDAESMIIDSFLNPALDRIDVDGVRSHYKGLVTKMRSNTHMLNVGVGS